jgi:hypothetical protein
MIREVKSGVERSQSVQKRMSARICAPSRMHGAANVVALPRTRTPKGAVGAGELLAGTVVTDAVVGVGESDATAAGEEQAARNSARTANAVVVVKETRVGRARLDRMTLPSSVVIRHHNILPRGRRLTTIPA